MTNLQTTRILIRFIYSMAVLLRDGHCTSKSDFKRELDVAEKELDAAGTETYGVVPVWRDRDRCPNCSSYSTVAAPDNAPLNRWCCFCLSYFDPRSRVDAERKIDATVQR